MGKLISLFVVILCLALLIIGLVQLGYNEYPKITEEQYNAIQVGMTLDEVAQVVGTKGKLVYESVVDEYSQGLKQHQAMFGEAETNKLKAQLGSLIDPKKYEDYKFAAKFKLKPIYLVTRPTVRLEFINGALVRKKIDREF
jgi:hypothetical protein